MDRTSEEARKPFNFPSSYSANALLNFRHLPRGSGLFDDIVDDDDIQETDLSEIEDILNATSPRTLESDAAGAPLSNAKVLLKTSLLEWQIIGVIGFVMSSLGAIFVIVLEIYQHVFARSSSDVEEQYLASIPHWLWATVVFMLILSVPITHGIAGKKKDKSYNFFQPFIGGTKFVLFQIIGWSLYGFTLLALGSVVYAAFSKVPIVKGLLATAGIGGALSQIFVLISLRHFDVRRKWYARRNLGLSEGISNAFSIDNIASFFITAFIYQIPLLFSLLNGAILFLGGLYSIIPVAVFAFLYSRTYKGNPHNTGVWSWPWFRNNLSFWSSIERYFSFKLIPHGKLEKDQVYMYGFHPHGIYPLTTFWATRGAQWRKCYPGVNLDILAASVIFYIPMIREIAMWGGGRDVSRTSIDLSFAQKRSVMLVPGGEREMRETRPESKEIRLIGRHKGFVRCALQYGVPLVPVYSFGEHQTLDNLRWKSMQEWWQKKILYGFPHLPYGRWYSPMPNAVPITLVVGDPIVIPKIPNPTSDEIDFWHKEYYKSLVSLFDKYKGQITSFEDATLVIV